MVTKTVLCADANGACKLVEVPFEWHQGEPLPLTRYEETFETAADALTELAQRGRAATRVHVPKPERKPAPAPTDTSPA